MDVVYGKTNVVLKHGGNRVPVRIGEPWDAADPLVEQYPDCFAAHVKAVRSTLDPRGFVEYEQAAETEAPVETATRAPGETRNVRRSTSRGNKA